MKRIGFLAIMLLLSGTSWADDAANIMDKLSKTLGSDAKSYFSESYTVGDASVKAELIEKGKKIVSMDDATIQRVDKVMTDYVRIDQATSEYNEKYKGKLESSSMENILMKRVIEDLTASKTSTVVIIKGLKSYNKSSVDALLTFMQLIALENVNGIENREKQFFELVRGKLGLPAFDQEFCKRVSGDHCTIGNATANPAF